MDDLNLSLSLHHKEHIYGLSSTSTIATNLNGEIICEDVKVNLGIFFYYFHIFFNFNFIYI